MIREYYQVPDVQTASRSELQDIIATLNRHLIDISVRLGVTTATDTTVIDTLVSSPVETTISSGSITVTGSDAAKITYMFVDTEGGAATDNLTRIYGGTENELLLIRSTSNSRAVTIINSAYIVIGADFTLNNTADTMLLVCKETDYWLQVARSSGA